MTTDKTYNGWTNYETWNVALWLDNDEGSQSYWREIAQDIWDMAVPDRIFTREEQATNTFADRLKDEIRDEELMPKVTGMYADLLGAALDEVNWHEIAEHYIADVDKEEEEAHEEEEA